MIEITTEKLFARIGMKDVEIWHLRQELERLHSILSDTQTQLDKIKQEGYNLPDSTVSDK